MGEYFLCILDISRGWMDYMALKGLRGKRGKNK